LSVKIRKSAVCGARRSLIRGGKGMREEKEIREALKRLKDECLRRARDPDSYSPLWLVATIGALECVLGDKKSLPDFD